MVALWICSHGHLKYGPPGWMEDLKPWIDNPAATNPDYDFEDIFEGLRTSTGLVVETGSAREVHHFALLAGYGAEAIHPYLALETLAEIHKVVSELDPYESQKRYIKAICKGLYKVMSKMGISTYQSYCGAQIFEAIGLDKAFVDRYFTWTATRVGGIVHMLRSGARWRDCPPEYGPYTTIYNRFVRWAERGIWENLFRKLAGNGRCADTQMIDSTHIKAHRSASGGKGGRKSRLWAVRAEGATRRSMHSQMLRGA
mgnify:CR=1 FL=1